MLRSGVLCWLPVAALSSQDLAENGVEIELMHIGNTFDVSAFYQVSVLSLHVHVPPIHNKGTCMVKVVTKMLTLAKNNSNGKSIKREADWFKFQLHSSIASSGEELWVIIQLYAHGMNGWHNIKCYEVEICAFLLHL